MYQKVVIPERCAPLNPGSRSFNRSCNSYLNLDSRFTVRPAGCPGMTKRGFTLIELLVVVLIIGILSAVALPQYQKAVEKSRIMALMPNLRTLKDSLEMYYLANGIYPNDSVADLDISISGCKAESSGQLNCGNACFNYNGGEKFTSDSVYASVGQEEACSSTGNSSTVITWYLDYSRANAGQIRCSSKVSGVCESLKGFLKE